MTLYPYSESLALPTTKQRKRAVAITNPKLGVGETRGRRLQDFVSSVLASIGGVLTINPEVRFSQIQQENQPDMPSTALLPHNQSRGEVNQKNNMVDKRVRRVLQDIGNFVIADAVVPEKKQIPQVVDAAGKRSVAVGRRRFTEKPIPENVIVISSAETEKTKSASRRTIDAGTSNKEVKKAFTSILAARSKAAYELTTDKPLKDQVVDIDEADIDNELAVVQYIDDIYSFYRLTEDYGRVHDYMDSQPEISAKMRCILVDWLVEVHQKFELMPETLYLGINIVDRFLSMKTVSRRELQLVGISSMLIACKYEEIWPPEVNDLVCISDNAYVRGQVLVMEKAILEKLVWYLTIPTPYVFLVRFIKATLPSDKEMENMAFFVAELGIMQYETIIRYGPSMIAASAVYTARCILDKSPLWPKTLKHYTGYNEDELKGCASLLSKFHSQVAESKHRAIFRKFSCSDRGAVALLVRTKS